MFAPNIAWRNVDLKAELEPRVDLPVVIENDANAAAWGEFRYGAGHDVDDLLLVTVGTGVGGGVVLDGELYRGAFGAGAEIGHVRVVPDGILCGCGNHGCFEQYASGSAMVREARAAGGRRLRARPRAARPGRGATRTRSTGPMITEAARDGDPFALEQLATVGRWLGEGIASLTAVLDPRWSSSGRSQRGRRPAAGPPPGRLRPRGRGPPTGRRRRSARPGWATRPDSSAPPTWPGASPPWVCTSGSTSAARRSWRPPCPGRG